MLKERGFPRVAVVIDAARSSLERARRMLSSPRGHADAVTEHRAILEALKARDSLAAAQAMNDHLNAVLTELITFMAVNPGAFEKPE